MPVLGNDHLFEQAAEAIDQRHDQIALGYGQLAARGEVVLHVNDQQGAAG